jgi:hypothetical protein
MNLLLTIYLVRNNSQIALLSPNPLVICSDLLHSTNSSTFGLAIKYRPQLLSAKKLTHQKPQILKKQDGAQSW